MTIEKSVVMAVNWHPTTKLEKASEKKYLFLTIFSIPAVFCFFQRERMG